MTLDSASHQHPPGPDSLGCFPSGPVDSNWNDSALSHCPDAAASIPTPGPGPSRPQGRQGSRGSFPARRELGRASHRRDPIVVPPVLPHAFLSPSCLAQRLVFYYHHHPGNLVVWLSFGPRLARARAFACSHSQSSLTSRRSPPIDLDRACCPSACLALHASHPPSRILEGVPAPLRPRPAPRLFVSIRSAPTGSSARFGVCFVWSAVVDLEFGRRTLPTPGPHHSLPLDSLSTRPYSSLSISSSFFLPPLPAVTKIRRPTAAQNTQRHRRHTLRFG